MKVQIDTLVNSLAAGAAGVKSIAEKIVELEKHQEQLNSENLTLEMEIEAAKKKVVSAQSMTESLTTFGDLYRDATRRAA